MKKIAKRIRKAVNAVGAAVGAAQQIAAPVAPVKGKGKGKGPVAPVAPVVAGPTFETPALAQRQTTGRRIIPGLDAVLTGTGLSREALIEAQQGPMRAILAYFPDEPGPRSEGPGRKTRAALFACGHGGPGKDGLGELCYVKPNGALYVTKQWRCRRCRDGAPVTEANAALLARVLEARKGNGGNVVLIRTGGSLAGSIPDGVPIA